jgi:pimeloyl-[acyl-carrier protein] methyl ester esterase
MSEPSAAAASIALVLLPGLDGSGVLFRPLLPHLPPAIRPIVIAYPPDRPLGYDELLPFVRDQLPADQPFAVLGESFSGPLAIRLAAEHPAHLRGVILCATFVRSPALIRRRWFARCMQPWMFRYFRTLAIGKAVLSGDSSPEIRQLLNEALTPVRPDVLCRRLRDVLQVDVTTALAACSVPLLYLRGDYDFVVPHRNAREIQAIQPAVQLVSLPTSHLVMQTQPERAARAIAEFLSR